MTFLSTFEGKNCYSDTLKHPRPPASSSRPRQLVPHNNFLKKFFKKNKITSPLWLTPKFTYTLRDTSGGNSVKSEKHSLHTYILLTINKLYPLK